MVNTENAEPAARSRVKREFGGLLPAEFRRHRRAARREKLSSWRSLLNGAIDELADPPAETAGHCSGRALREFEQHRRAARREKALACRSLLDAFLDFLGEPGPATQKATKVDIE